MSATTISATTTASSRRDLTEHLAFLAIAIGPALAFSAVPLPGGGGEVKAALVLVVAVLAAGYLRRPVRCFPIWEWTLIALLLLSIAWSDEPQYTAERLRSAVPIFLMMVIGCSLLRPARIIRALEVAVGLILASSLVVLLLDPSKHERHGQFVIYAQFPKNTFGGLLGVALILVLARPRRFNKVLIPLLILAIGLNYSVTAWLVVTVVGVASLGARWAARNLRATSKAPALLVALVVGGGAVVLAVVAGGSSELEAVGKDSSLGTRNAIWAACWQEIQKAPLLGHGAWTFLEAASRSPVTLEVWSHFHGFEPPHPHNGFLDLWGQLGIVGLLVFFALVGRALSCGIRLTLRGDPTARAATTVVLFLLMFGATEPSWIGEWLSLSLPCTIACARAWAFRNDPDPADGIDGIDGIDVRDRPRILGPQRSGPEVPGLPAPALSGARGKPPFTGQEQGS